MRIKTVKRTEEGRTAEGGRYSLHLSLPYRQEDDAVSARINAFYQGLAERLSAAVKEKGGSFVSEVIPIWEGAEGTSLLFDVLYYRGKELLSCVRIADNRTPDGYPMELPRRMRHRLTEGGGWYRDAEQYYFYRSLFDGIETVRRSEYRRLFPIVYREDIRRSVRKREKKRDGE